MEAVLFVTKDKIIIFEFFFSFGVSSSPHGSSRGKKKFQKSLKVINRTTSYTLFIAIFFSFLVHCHIANGLFFSPNAKFTLKIHSEQMSLSIFPCTTIILEHLSHSGFVASLMRQKIRQTFSLLAKNLKKTGNCTQDKIEIL